MIIGGDKIPRCPYHDAPLLAWEYDRRGVVTERRCGMQPCGWRWSLGRGRYWVITRGK